MLSILEKSITLHRDLLYFAPFLIISVLISINDHDWMFVKYASYIAIYFFLARYFFLKSDFFKLYVNLLTILSLVLLAIYAISVVFDLHENFLLEELTYLSTESPMNSVNHRSMIFYILVYDYHDFSGIFNIPRFYGFSREPGMYVMFTIPAMLIAYYFKMKVQAIILLLTTIITSSFAGYVTLLLLFAIVFFKVKNVFMAVFIFVVTFLFLKNYLYLLDIERISSYLELLHQITERYTYSIMHINNYNNLLFIAQKLSFSIIIYKVLNKVLYIDLRIILLFFVASFLLISKANEILSPLLLFYISFIDYAYKKKVNKLRAGL